MHSFDFQPQTRMVFGAGVLSKLGLVAGQLGCRRAMVVCDHGVVQVGHFSRAKEFLTAAGIEVGSFHELKENPTTSEVAMGLEAAQDFKPDLLIGLGGGSSMDCAKGINFLYSCGGRMQDYWGVGKATGTMLPMIAVPTTAGTGSESQSFALISDAETHVKMACGDARAACKIAVLDPELTLTLPARITALTGIDAITHALETFVTTKKNPLSRCYSREAWRLLSRGFPGVLENPDNLEARGQMLLGASFAGLAIETSMLGAAHACANPLTTHFGIAHGQAVGIMMPHVIKFNAHLIPETYVELWRETYPSHRNQSTERAPVDELANWMRRMIRSSGLAVTLEECGVHRDKIGQLSMDATKQWTATFNPRPVQLEDFERMYEAAFAE